MRKNILPPLIIINLQKEILDAKIKEKKLVAQYDISNLVRNSDLNTKAKLKEQQDKIIKLQTHDFHHTLGKNVFGDDGFQNVFFYQPTVNTLELKEDKGTDYVVGWKSKGIFL